MFPLDSPSDPPPPSEGSAAAAIRAAETALARQNTVAAQVDLQVVTAVLNAHGTHAEGSAALAALQRDIESAVATRTDLDTPAGAREFQRYLLDRLQEIRAVVTDTRLDDTSRAALAAALASLYATAGDLEAPTVAPPPPLPPPPTPPSTPAPLPEPAPVPVGDPVDLGLEPDLSDLPGVPPLADVAEPPVPSAPPAEQATLPAAAPAAPGPALAAPALPALGGMPPLAPALSELFDRFEPGEPADPDDDSEDPDAESAGAQGTGDGAADPRPELTGVIADAVAGVPIADAFGRHGISIPAPGAVLDAPLTAAEVVRGDVGVFADRHALALGNGKALVDNQIQAIDTMNQTGFLGWSHPPER